MLANLLLENYSRLRLIKREEIENVITFANALAKSCYDNIYQTL